MPRNAAAIAEARARGMRPAQAVVVSFVGALALENPTVYADSGKPYDWSWAADLTVWIAVKAGVNASDAIRSLAEVAKPYPGLVDVESRGIAFITSAIPRVRLWHAAPGNEWEQEIFGCN